MFFLLWGIFWRLCSDSTIYVSIKNKIPAHMVDIRTAEEEKGRNHDMGEVVDTWIKDSTYINVTKSHVAIHLKVLFTCIDITISIKDDL